MILTNDILIMEIGSQRIYHNDGTRPRLMFDPEAIAGWDDTPGVRRDQTSRPGSHGDFEDKGYYEGRLVTISGFAVTNHARELHQLRDSFVRELQTPMELEPIWVMVTNGAGYRYMKATQGSGLSWVQVTDTYAKWKLDLYAADPRQYGELKHSQVFSATQDTRGIDYTIGYPLDWGTNTAIKSPILYNNGNSRSWPKFIVRGDLPSGFSITNGGSKSVTFTGPVFSGSPVTIDMFDGTATVAGVDRSYQLSRRDWFFIPSLSSIKPKLVPTIESDITADIEWRDTWI